jgi:hypothetical protein
MLTVVAIDMPPVSYLMVDCSWDRQKRRNYVTQ